MKKFYHGVRGDAFDGHQYSFNVVNGNLELWVHSHRHQAFSLASIPLSVLKEYLDSIDIDKEKNYI